MSFSINTNNNGEKNLWEIKLAGEIDISNVNLVKNQLEAVLEEAKQSIEIDLSELDYIDSSGLGMIIKIYGAIKKDGLSVKLINPKDSIKKLLIISGLDKILS